MSALGRRARPSIRFEPGVLLDQGVVPIGRLLVVEHALGEGRLPEEGLRGVRGVGILGRDAGVQGRRKLAAPALLLARRRRCRAPCRRSGSWGRLVGDSRLEDGRRLAPPLLAQQVGRALATGKPPPSPAKCFLAASVPGHRTAISSSRRRDSCPSWYAWKTSAARKAAAGALASSGKRATRTSVAPTRDRSTSGSGRSRPWSFPAPCCLEASAPQERTASRAASSWVLGSLAVSRTPSNRRAAAS